MERVNVEKSQFVVLDLNLAALVSCKDNGVDGRAMLLKGLDLLSHDRGGPRRTSASRGLRKVRPGPPRYWNVGSPVKVRPGIFYRKL